MKKTSWSIRESGHFAFEAGIWPAYEIRSDKPYAIIEIYMPNERAKESLAFLKRTAELIEKTLNA